MAEGTVTAVHLKAATAVRNGAQLYDVDLSPVFVAQGVVPAFRPLAVGMQGADVRQFQEMLIAVGKRSAPATGRYDSQTARQARTWQRATRQSPTGEIALGVVVFVPSLPATVALGDGITVGAQVNSSNSTSSASSNSEADVQDPNAGAVIRVLPPAPTFTITVPESQGRLVRAGMRVSIDYQGGPWTAIVERLGEPGQDGSALATLKSPSSKPICEAACRRIPVAGESGLDASIQIVPEVRGVVVPAAALVVAPDGTTALRKEDGTEIPVKVKASVAGRSIVDGVNQGDRIQVAANSAS